MPLIRDCLKDWKKMDGETNEEKRINAYLCNKWIFRYDVPSDECVSYAKKMVKIKNPRKDIHRIKRILLPFVTYQDTKGKWKYLMDKEKINNMAQDMVAFLLLIRE